MSRRRAREWAVLDRRLRLLGYWIEQSIPTPVIHRPDGGIIALLEDRPIDVDSARRFVEWLERAD